MAAYEDFQTTCNLKGKHSPNRIFSKLEKITANLFLGQFPAWEWAEKAWHQARKFPNKFDGWRHTQTIAKKDWKEAELL